MVLKSIGAHSYLSVKRFFEQVLYFTVILIYIVIIFVVIREYQMIRNLIYLNLINWYVNAVVNTTVCQYFL